MVYTRHARTTVVASGSDGSVVDRELSIPSGALVLVGRVLLRARSLSVAHWIVKKVGKYSENKDGIFFF